MSAGQLRVPGPTVVAPRHNHLILRYVKSKLSKFPACLNPFLFGRTQLHGAYSQESRGNSEEICSQGLRASASGQFLSVKKPALPLMGGSPLTKHGRGRMYLSLQRVTVRHSYINSSKNKVKYFRGKTACYKESLHFGLNF